MGQYEWGLFGRALCIMFILGGKTRQEIAWSQQREPTDDKNTSFLGPQGHVKCTDSICTECRYDKNPYRDYPIGVYWTFTCLLLWATQDQHVEVQCAGWSLVHKNKHTQQRLDVTRYWLQEERHAAQYCVFVFFFPELVPLSGKNIA